MKKLITRIVLIALTFAFVMIPSTKNTNAATLKIAQVALTRVGCSYKSGAAHSASQIKNKNQKQFDCSGLVNWSYYHAGYNIGSKTSSSYKKVGKAVKYNKLQPGDILVFKGHVGIYVGNDKMVHAPGRRKKVQVVKLGSYWKKRLVSARRVG